MNTTEPKKKASMNKQILNMTQELIHNHYERRSEAVFDKLADNVIWIGPYEFQRADNLDTFKEIVAPEQLAPAVTLTNEEYHLLSKTGSMAIVYGTYLATAIPTSGEIIQTKTRFTIIWHRIKGEFKVVHMHVSNSQDYPSLPDKTDEEDFFQYIGRFSKINSISSTAAGSEEKIAFRDQEGYHHFLYPSEIIRLEASNVLCCVHYQEGSFWFRGKISDYEKKLSDQFLRIHRGHLVNLSYVTGIRRYRVRLLDGSEIPVAKERYLDSRKRISEGVTL